MFAVAQETRVAGRDQGGKRQGRTEGDGGISLHLGSGKGVL